MCMLSLPKFCSVLMIFFITDSRSPSQGSANSGSPSPTCELTVENHVIHKDSPTPDRDSLHIEMVAASDESNLPTGNK